MIFLIRLESFKYYSLKFLVQKLAEFSSVVPGILRIYCPQHTGDSIRRFSPKNDVFLSNTFWCINIINFRARFCLIWKRLLWPKLFLTCNPTTELLSFLDTIAAAMWTISSVWSMFKRRLTRSGKMMVTVVVRVPWMSCPILH